MAVQHARETLVKLNTTVRAMSLSTLKETCKKISTHCHTFKVVYASSHRVSVSYSNPDEYGTPSPVTVEYAAWYDREFKMTVVANWPLRTIGMGDSEAELIQPFDMLWEEEK